MDSLTTQLTTVRAAWREPRFRDYISLTKPRLSLMSVISAILGYFAAAPAGSLVTFFGLTLGTAAAAFGAAALNQWWERVEDAKMARTADRPAAAGRVAAPEACLVGLLLSVLGVVLMYVFTNSVATLLTASTIAIYVLAYTPLKKVSPWATEVGALAGALPPLIGWTASGEGFGFLGWVLVFVLFAWQMPHFMAISWMYRDDYARAGFAVLAVSDGTGNQVSRRSLIWTLALWCGSLLPLLDPAIGWFLGTVAVVLGSWMMAANISFCRSRQRARSARYLFFTTLVYLPLYMCALVADRFMI